MCGLVGYFGNPNRLNLERALDQIAHRGPDGRGVNSSIWHPADSGQPYGLGHCRLSIIDIEKGAQPFIKRQYVLVFNGEIYNYKEVADYLARHHGVTFDTRSDTEVLLEAYANLGPECLDRLEGMWAFLILDRTSGAVLCARDRFGEKPLYFVSRSDGFYFCSELKPLLPCVDQARIDADMLARYLIGSASVQDRSFVAGIRQLAPGHQLQFAIDKPSALRISKYWQVSAQEGLPVPSLEDAAEELRELVAQSVRMRLRSDVPVGVAVSGGLDSSILFGLASGFSDEITAASVTFDRSFNHDETPFIAAFTRGRARKAITTSCSVDLSFEDFLESVRFAIDAIGEPTPYTSVPFVASLYRLARDSGIKVLMEGQGADELFGGYTYFRAFQTMAFPRAFCTLTDWLISCRARRPSLQKAYLASSTFFALLDRNLRKEIEANPPSLSVNDALVDSQSSSILPSILGYTDRLSMKFGVEVRLPYLDRKLVETINSWPGELKVRGRETKVILRNAYRDVLPNHVTSRPKVGFGNPTVDLIGRYQSGFMQKFVTHGSVANSNFFNRPLREVWERNLFSVLPNSRRLLWRLAVVDIWARALGLEVSHSAS